uniref:Uncharacterized protein n=1 Tax=Parascaris univalens TaxID=6257 RepID=A0A914ZTK1_PARUN
MLQTPDVRGDSVPLVSADVFFSCLFHLPSRCFSCKHVLSPFSVFCKSSYSYFPFSLWKGKTKGRILY